MADRLSIDAKYNDYITSVINDVDMLNMATEGSLTDIFLFAMSLGVKEGRRTPSRKKVGVIRTDTVNNRDDAPSYIYSVALDELRLSGKENLIQDNNEVYKIAEEYANTGFQILQEKFPSRKEYDEESFLYEIIEMLDEKFNEIKNHAE